MSDHKHSALGAGLFGKESSTSYEVYLNLTPLMDVMSNILFFLLAAFGASAVAIFSVTVPVDASSEAAPSGPPEDRVTVTLRADAAGITLGCSDPVKLPEDLASCNVRLPKAGNKYDLPALTGALKAIKQKFSGASTIVVVPDDNIKYETVVSLLDAARDFKQPDGKRLQLFPDVVMSSLVK